MLGGVLPLQQCPVKKRREEANAFISAKALKTAAGAAAGGIKQLGSAVGHCFGAKPPIAGAAVIGGFPSFFAAKMKHFKAALPKDRVEDQIILRVPPAIAATLKVSVARNEKLEVHIELGEEPDKFLFHYGKEVLPGSICEFRR